MTDITILASRLRERFAGVVKKCSVVYGEVTFELDRQDLKQVCLALRDEPAFEFKQLMDVCGVDYLHYGQAEWQTTGATSVGFDRAVTRLTSDGAHSDQPRFAVVYHLLSLSNNQRLRLKVRLPETQLSVDSMVSVWPSANWFEREAYDLFGIVFRGHPDMRRILTDYGFTGHPLRKDFPVSGHMEVRYDAEQGKVIYEPVSIEPRVLVPKVIRTEGKDHV